MNRGAEGTNDGQAQGKGRGEILSMVLLLGWALPTSLFFFIRFSFVFYQAHAGAIGDVIQRIVGH